MRLNKRSKGKELITGDHGIKRHFRQERSLGLLISCSYLSAILFNVEIRVVEASQAGAEGRAIKVHEESRGISRELQVGDHLRETDGLQVIDGFQLDDDALVDQQVDPEPAGRVVSLAFPHGEAKSGSYCVAPLTTRLNKLPDAVERETRRPEDVFEKPFLLIS
jgi:hypothetical protein